MVVQERKARVALMPKSGVAKILNADDGTVQHNFEYLLRKDWI
jgi:hypothetical protein